MRKNIKIIKSQMDTGVSAISAIGWLTEQGIQALMGEGWSKVPFLEIAVIIGFFSLGRNFHSLNEWVEARFAPVKFVKSDTNEFDGRRALFYSIEFRKNMTNPKLQIEVLEHLELLGERCCFEIIGIAKKSFNQNFNCGEKYDTCLLYDPKLQTKNQLENQYKKNETDPRCMERGPHGSSKKQYRVKLTVTSENKKPACKVIDIYVPSGNRQEHLEGYLMPCLQKSLEERKSSKFKSYEIQGEAM